MKLLRVAHAGRVLCRGFFFGPPLGEDEARARILARFRPGATVRRTEGGLVLLLAEPTWVRVDASPGAPLVAQAHVLSSAPLTNAELVALAAPPEALVLARAGAAVVLAPRAGDEEDPARWLDTSEVIVLGVTSLGAPPPAPRVAPAPPPLDVRAALKAPAASAELAAVRAALEQMRAGVESSAGRSLARAETSSGGMDAFARAARTALAGVARLFASVLGLFGRAASASESASRRTSEAASSRALAARPAPPSGPSFLERLRARVLDVAARLLVLSRIARFFERAHAQYLSKMIDMFERGDLEDALRHAIPLGQGDGSSGPPALLPGGPRADLSISPWRAPARGAIGLGGALFEDLRTMYRRAFERLVAMGAIERAAFVLAELLGANEEAVSFLERHGKYELAAQIAEARDLPPGLVVRQWLLAGDTPRAIAIARAKGAFADAVARLERAGPPYASLAVPLRLRWADVLAESGAYAAAVDVVWPVESARPLARAWIERALLVGGATAGTMLARKASLPGTFAEVRAQVLTLFGDAEPEIDATRVAFASALAAGPATAETRVLARPAARALLAGRAAAAALGRRKSAALAERLAVFSNDPALRADMRPLVVTPRVPNIRISVAGFSMIGERNINEDAIDFGHLMEGGRRAHGTNLTVHGFFLHVLDGSGGGEPPRHPATIAADAVHDVLTRDAGAGRTRDALARDLRAAVREANRRIFEASTRDVRMRGMGSTSTCAALVDGALVVSQVGDSRAYLLRGMRFEQLTRDDSLLEAYKDQPGSFTEVELADLPQNIITKALGMASELEPRISVVPLQRGDVVLLTTDGVHALLPSEALPTLARGARDARGLIEAIRARMAVAQAADNYSAVVARFDGTDLPVELSPGPSASPYEPAPSSLANVGEVSLTSRVDPLVHAREEGDVGALAIHDAALLPDGRLLVALGELGVRLLSPAGKTLAHFGEPAHHLVVSTFGDRAIALASRGDAWRVAKIDLVGRRVRAWHDARFDRWAPSFDGARFFCSLGARVFAVDAIADDWSATWTVTVDEGKPSALSVDANELCVVVTRAKDAHVLWRYDLATMTLRGRTPSMVPPRLGWSWESSDDMVSLLDADGRARLALRLRGARSPCARVDGADFVVFDDRGRLIVLSRATGEVLREHRVAP